MRDLFSGGPSDDSDGSINHLSNYYDDENCPSVVFNGDLRVVRVFEMDEGEVCIEKTEYGNENKNFGTDQMIMLSRDEAISVARALLYLLPILKDGGKA